MSGLVFRKPGRRVEVYECSNPGPSRRVQLLERLLVGALFLLLACVLYLAAVEHYRASGEPVRWGMVATAIVLSLAAIALVGMLARWTQRRMYRLLDRHTFAWIDARGVGLWIGLIGLRIPYDQIERVTRLRPAEAPRWWRLLFDRDAFVGVRIDRRGGALSGGVRYLFVDRTEPFLEELERRAAARGRRIELPPE